MTDADEERTTAVELRAPEGARVVEIDWADGFGGRIRHEVLRGFCPCAECQGHQGPIRFVEGGDLELTDIQEVGNYALQLTWGDGHATGIYSFSYLRRLCEAEGERGADPQDLTFSR